LAVLAVLAILTILAILVMAHTVTSTSTTGCYQVFETRILIGCYRIQKARNLEINIQIPLRRLKVVILKFSLMYRIKNLHVAASGIQLPLLESNCCFL
jgi:hypothetical protein